MWVVKLGGSLLGTPELGSWLALLARCGNRKIVVVPGGGLFAEGVRDAQRLAGFDDGVAHRMALLAMEQYGLALQSLQPELVTAASARQLRAGLSLRRAVIWLPSQMVLAEAAIAMNWSVTSDSLAAWLARKIHAERLILVKSVALGATPLPLRQLSEQGILDAAFGSFASVLECPIHVVSKFAHAAFAAALAGATLAANPL